MRKITPEVPEHYMPQLQLLMEILDLEEAVFIQYKPIKITWPGEPEFMVTEIKRDRQWFQDKLPIMENLWKRVLHHREHGVGDLLKPKRTRKPTQKNNEVTIEPCIIQDYDEDIHPKVFSDE